MNLPLIRRARQLQKEAGLAGPDPVSKFTDALLTLAAALSVRQPDGHPGRDRAMAAVVVGSLLLAALAAGVLGYRWGRAETVRICAVRLYSTPEGTACLMWPNQAGSATR